MWRRSGLGIVMLFVLTTACSEMLPGSSAPERDLPTMPALSSSTSTSSTTSAAPSTTMAPTTTSTTTTSTTTTSTTTTTTEPPLEVYDPACVVRVRDGDSLNLIAARFDDETVDAETLMAENGLGSDMLFPDQLLDVCVDNGLNDITGEAKLERNPALVQRGVELQQEKLNELFEGLGIRELLVDGISGPVTRQRLCAFRLAVGLPVTRDDMELGGDEEEVLMATEVLPVPFTSAVQDDRWILIDLTCQIMFVGERYDRLVFVFPTSTGEPGYETRLQHRSPIVRFNPALDNGGWHNSSVYPVAEDNPLNGNMYKPLYFDRGQAIHGANNVPRSPASKGCARLRVEDQDLLVWWLGLADSGPTTNRSRIDAVVNVQGVWVP